MREELIRSTPQSRPNNITRGLKCSYIRPQKSFSDFNEIFYVDKGQ